MPAIKMDVHTTRSQDLCDEQPEFAITKYGNTRSLWNGRLIENLTCRRERLNENSFLIGNRIGNDMHIHLRQRQQFPKRAGVPHDSKNGSFRAIHDYSSLAPLALAARQVVPADYSASTQFCMSLVDIYTVTS